MVYNIILRIDKKGEPIIFYRTIFKYPLPILTCFDGCHSEAHFDYYYNSTKPAKTKSEKAKCNYLLEILFGKKEKYKIYKKLDFKCIY